MGKTQLASANVVLGAGLELDWNELAKETIVGGLGEVPAVGPILSMLTSLLWPDSKDIWAEIEQRVQALINQSISALVKTQLHASLAGLHDNLQNYLVTLNTATATPGYLTSVWNTTNGIFLQERPNFQLPGYELALLTEFAQFANMHLSLLRDAAIAGSSWGWEPALVQKAKTDLTKKIREYSVYANRIYQAGLTDRRNGTKANAKQAQPFRSVNSYVRAMTLQVLDFVNLWPYLDVSVYPNGTKVTLEREIYSDPHGSCDDSGDIIIAAAPTQPMQQLTVWGWDRIDAVQATYPANGGPGGVTTTARMGNTNGGANTSPHGGIFQVANNPIVEASGRSGSIVNSMQFKFADGTSTGKLGGNYIDGHGSGDPFTYSYPNHILSSIHINGVSKFYGSADCVVFGFKYQQSVVVQASVQQQLKIAAPQLSGSDASSLSAADTAARKALWASREAHAKTLKLIPPRA